MRILTSEEVRQAEGEATKRAGVSTATLMHAAGYAVAQFCLAHFKFSSVCVVCGKGNNGGDGLVAAEALRGSASKVSVIVLAKDISELSADAAAMCARLGEPPIWAPTEADLDSDAVRQALAAELIIDAIVGTGFKPPLRGVARKAVEAINDAFGTIVSVDVPSGVDADATTAAHQTSEDAVFAHGVITFIAPKPAHVLGELTAGPIAVSEIGVQPALVSNQTGLQVITGQEVGIAFPARANDAHKGEFGHVLVIAGSCGKAGAAGLAGMAALYAGAGLVTVACPQSIQATVAGFAPELMTEGLPETEAGSLALEASERVDRLMAGKSAVVLGPGLSQTGETAEFVRRLVARCPLPLVLDADGLNAFDGHYEELKPRADGAFRVLTPHPGEAARLLGISIEDIQADRLATAKRLARESGACVALKGWRTVVAGLSGETWINLSGNPALAKGGSGDVLAGMMGAALARHRQAPPSAEAASAEDFQPAKSWFQEIYGADSQEKMKRYQAQELQRTSAQAAAFLKDVSVAAAVHLHGIAADIARDRLHENTVLARDVMESLAEAFHACELQVEQGLFYLQR